MGNEKEKKDSFELSNEAVIDEMPLDKRTSWLSPAVIYAGCEFCIPVIMVGSGLMSSYSMGELLLLVVVGLVIFTWLGDSLTSYLGASTGRSSSVIARASFGTTQSRIIVAFGVFFIGLGWWSIQTAVAGNAICAMLGIDYTTQWGAWAIVTIICGIIFAVPSIIGYSSMKWTDYIAVPAGLLILIWTFILALKNVGTAGIMTWAPVRTIPWAQAVTMILGLNTCQWLMIADYSRFCKPKLMDNFLMPSLIIVVGFILIMMGGVLGITNSGGFDIVEIMVGLGFPVFGFVFMFLAQWTSQLVNNYSMGLSLCNMFNVRDDKGRMIMTIVGTVIALALALAGILNQFMNVLSLMALIYPPIAAAMIVDYFILRKKQWVEIPGWNITATITIIIGTIIGYYTTYVIPIGIPPVQSWILSAILYYVLMYAKAKIRPDKFTPEIWMQSIKNN